MTENVLNFPRDRIVREHAGIMVDDVTLEQAKERSRANFAESISDELISIMLEEMENLGIDTSLNSFMKDFSLTVDALRATINRSFDVPHHLHDFIDEHVKMIHKETGKLVELDEDEEDDNLDSEKH